MFPSMALCKKKILCVDDDADDRLFLTEAINDMNPEVSVVSVENGIEAMNYLNDAKTEASNLPCLIVLDINMPLLDGKQTFQRLKDDPELKKIPVVVFTSSENPNDRQLFRNLGVLMLSKPDNLAYMNRVA